MNSDLVIKKVGQVLGEKIKSCIKITKGISNEVYKVETNDKNYIVRIFNSKDWPEEGKLAFITDKLIENNITTANNIFITRDDADFENGYMIQEFLEGVDVQDILNDKISEEDYFRRLGELVRQVHKIKIKNYGYIGSGVANHKTFADFMINEIDEMEEKILDMEVCSKSEYQKIKRSVLNTLAPIQNLPSVLIHTDIYASNVMLVDGELVLIDWDNAMASNWIHDYSYMTYWMNWGTEDKTKLERNKDLFLEGYNPDFDLDSLEKTEKAFHLFYSLKMLTFTKKKTDRFDKILKYTNELYKLKKEDC